MIELLKEALKLTIGFFVLLCMGMSVLFPLTVGMKDNPNWIGFVIYPVTILAISYINLKNKKEDGKKTN